MVLHSSFNTSPLCCDFPRRDSLLLPSVSHSPFLSSCSCAANRPFYLSRKWVRGSAKNVRWVLLQVQACVNGGNQQRHFNSAAGGGAKNIVLKRFMDEEEVDYASSPVNVDASSVNYYSTSFVENPIVDKLRKQLGVIHPLPSPPMNRSILGLFAFFFLVGVIFDKLWTSRKMNTLSSNSKPVSWPWVPASLPLFLERDLQRKESVEWVNMVLGKLWKVYRGGIENWIMGLLQPVIDDLKKPDYVQRVEIKQFSLGDEPLSVRSVERRTSRRSNDLQYQIGLRYTGDARMLLLLSLKFGFLPIVVPVRVRDFDIDGELWVKLRLIPTEPWVGAVSWAFVSLPKIKFELSPFRLFNLMAIPVLSMFLTKLLTEDLPKLFVRPKKIVLDFQKGKAVGVVPNDPKSGESQDGNSNFVGELSVTLLDARKLTYLFYGETDPYVILTLGDQVIRSKKNSQTTVIGPPGEPIWNQDFHMLVADNRTEKLYIEVRDSLGFMESIVGTAEVDLASLKDTVPVDRIVPLRGQWSLFGNRSAGEILLHLTYKAYVEDEEDERSHKVSRDAEVSEDEASDNESDTRTTEQRVREYITGTSEESFMDVLAALLVSEEFRGIVASETAANNKSTETGTNSRPSEPPYVTNGGPGKQISSGNSSSSQETGTNSSPSEPPYVINGGPGKQISSGNSSSSQGSPLLWLAIATSISILIALNMGGTSLFNP